MKEVMKLMMGEIDEENTMTIKEMIKNLFKK